jgi:hypothetical protein
LLGALQAEEARRIGTERKIQAERADRSTVSNPNADVLHHVIEVLEVPLAETEADVTQ